MKLKIIINNHYEKHVFKITYQCSDTILVRDFWKDIHDKYFKSYVDIELDYLSIACFSFINNGNEQKAKLDYKLKDFLKNFDYDFNDINIFFRYGFGWGFEFEDIAIIKVNGNEPHYEPHVHIYSGKQSEECIRIALNTMTQMKGDKTSFEKLFKSKERKKIIKFLNDNKEKIIDFYKRCNKGEYIMEEYVLTYGNKKYFLYTRPSY